MRAAIIDIGYNAIRVVVYESNELGAPEIFNNKFRSEIRNLLSSGNLETKHHVYLSFQYIAHIFKKLSVTNVKCVATAVLRSHPKAEAFKAIIKTRYNIDIDIISGDREAYLSASGIADASGIVADLGGGSLELAEIFGGKISVLKSLPIGTKLLEDNISFTSESINNMLEHVVGNKQYKNLYLIGGAFRMIGRHYMQFVQYPLKNLHNLTINNIEFLEYLERLSRAPSQKNCNLRAIDTKAIVIVRSIIHASSPKDIVISNYGLKEGVRFFSLSPAEQKKNIIYERIKALVKFDKNICAIEKYVELVKTLVIQHDEITIMVLELAIILAPFNRNIDKNLRANFVVEFILSCDIPFNHRSRVMLALTLAFTYRSKNDMYIHRLGRRMLSKVDYSNSDIIGSFLKIARQIDGPEFQSPSFSFILDHENNIEIDTLKILPKSIFKQVMERIKNINEARNS